MDYPIQIDTISMELSILYFKRLMPIKISIKCNSVLEDCFNLANSADPVLALFAKVPVYQYPESRMKIKG